MATYLYCAVSRPRSPAVRRPPRGLPGLGPPRVLDAGRHLWLIVADAPLARYGADPIERGLQDLDWVSRCAMAHEGMVEHFARGGTMLPMRLFTLFSNDERALAHIGRARKTIDRALQRVTGRGEWGLRLILDERKVGRPTTGDRREGRRAVSGTDFLLKKKAEKDAVRRLQTDAARQADRLFEDLARRADDARRRRPEPARGPVRVVLDAAFLVPIPRARAFSAAARVHARSVARAGFDLVLTGPWPPYTFVTDAR